MMSVINFLRQFYPGRYGEVAARAYAANPTKYFTQVVGDVDGVISFEDNLGFIDLKLLAGSRGLMKRLLEPFSGNDLLIKVPASLSDYLNDLRSLGFIVDSGQDLLLLKRSGDN